jgi:hypothetical protein
MNMLAALLLAVLAQQEAPPQEERPKIDKSGPKRAADEIKIDLHAGVELLYDDNVTELNDEDVRALEDDLRPEKFRIKQPDDFITAPWVEVLLKAPLLKDPMTLGLRAQGYLYATNTIKNYEEIGVFARQKLGDRDRVELEYQFIPDFYRREYRVPGTAFFDSAFYANHEVELSWRHKFHEIVSVRPKASFQFRDYDAPFDFRDSVSYVLGLRGDIEPLPWLELRLEYEFEDLTADAASTQPDISHRQHGIEPSVIVRPLAGLRLEVKYRIEFREYTTSNSAVLDPSHRDREDRIDRIVFGASYRITPNWEVEFTAELWRRDSDRPSDPGATDEETSYDRNIFSVGLTWRM